MVFEKLDIEFVVLLFMGGEGEEKRLAREITLKPRMEIFSSSFSLKKRKKEGRKERKKERS